MLNDPLILSAMIALLVSVNFGVASHIQQIALDHMDVRSGTIVNIATSALIFWLLSPFYLSVGTLTTPPVALFALAGLIVPALSITLATLSVQAIGPGLTAGLSATSPIFAMTIAVLFLGEIVTGQILTGTLIVIAGIVLIAFRSKRVGVDWPLWALALPLGAALTRGISHPLMKLGLTGLPSPLTAALVSSTVSLGVLATVHVASRRKMPQMLNPLNRGYLWFALCGVINGFGIVGLAVALEMGSVVIVSPLVATTPAFTLLMGYFFFRRERVGWTAVGAIAMIFVGVVLILLR